MQKYNIDYSGNNFYRRGCPINNNISIIHNFHGKARDQKLPVSRTRKILRISKNNNTKIDTHGRSVNITKKQCKLFCPCANAIYF